GGAWSTPSTASDRSTRSPAGSSKHCSDAGSRRGRPPDVAFGRGVYKSPAQLRAMVEPGLITAAALDAVRELVAPGETTEVLDGAAARADVGGGARTNFQRGRGYRHAGCTAVNGQAVPGIPGPRRLEAGDIVSIDAGAEFRGWNGDAAITVVL